MVFFPIKKRRQHHRCAAAIIIGQQGHGVDSNQYPFMPLGNA
jgi:hypothetical protein